MKGISHLLISFFILFVFLLFGIFSKLSFFSYFSLGVLFIGGFLFVLGSLLPDSDSQNKKSLIYVFVPISLKKTYKRETDGEKIGKSMLLFLGIIVYPIAYITNQLEMLLAIYTKRKRGHKESLHTIFGILIISLFWVSIFYFIYLKITLESLNLLVFFFWLCCLFISQLLHLLEDSFVEKQGWKISWK